MFTHQWVVKIWYKALSGRVLTFVPAEKNDLHNIQYLGDVQGVCSELIIPREAIRFQLRSQGFYSLTCTRPTCKRQKRSLGTRLTSYRARKCFLRLNAPLSIMLLFYKNLNSGERACAFRRFVRVRGISLQ